MEDFTFVVWTVVEQDVPDISKAGVSPAPPAPPPPPPSPPPPPPPPPPWVKLSNRIYHDP